MSDRKITYGTFSLSRTLAAEPAKVFNAFADEQAKLKWFGSPSAKNGEHSMDFREGGSEMASGEFHGGTRHRFDAHYYDIVPNERIVYTYEMHMNGERISVSLATIEIRPNGAGSQLTLTESGAYLDGFDNPDQRQRGTEDLMDALEKSLKD